MFFGFLQVFQVLCRLTVNPGLSRGISVCFSVVVAWQTVEEAVWSSFGEDFVKKVEKLEFSEKCQKLTLISIRNLTTTSEALKQLAHVTVNWNISFCYQFNAVLTKFWVNFCKFSQFSAVFRGGRKLSPDSTRTIAATSESLQTLAYIATNSEIFFWVQSVQFGGSISEKFLELP